MIPNMGYNRNAFAHRTLPMKIVGTTVKLITMPIGLASEATHELVPESDGLERDEADWALDDATVEEEPPALQKPKSQFQL